MNRSVAIGALAFSSAVFGLLCLYFYGRGLWYPLYLKAAGPQTVTEAVASIGPSARKRIKPYFDAVDMTYPPKTLTLLAVKDAALLEVWAGPESSPTFIRTYDIKALSGVSGPKLREGDRQVPEGVYQITGLNPNSSYHLSMKLNYPNAFDLRHAQKEGRTEPGSNIFIHGKALSIGCLAMGDDAIEELFVVVHDVGRRNVRVVIAPTDPRISPLAVGTHPAWVETLYRDIEKAFRGYIRPGT